MNLHEITTELLNNTENILEEIYKKGVKEMDGNDKVTVIEKLMELLALERTHS